MRPSTSYTFAYRLYVIATTFTACFIIYIDVMYLCLLVWGISLVGELAKGWLFGEIGVMFWGILVGYIGKVDELGWAVHTRTFQLVFTYDRIEYYFHLYLFIIFADPRSLNHTSLISGVRIRCLHLSRGPWAPLRIHQLFFHDVFWLIRLRQIFRVLLIPSTPQFPKHIFA